jgi:lysyl-tRNA synthetase class 2
VPFRDEDENAGDPDERRPDERNERRQRRGDQQDHQVREAEEPDRDRQREPLGERGEERRRDGSGELPCESRLLQAMEAGLPACSGCALGVDRFLATLLGAKSLDETLAFPIEIA